MTDNVSPSANETVYSYLLARAVHEHGSVGDGWIVPSDETILGDHEDAIVADAPFESFRYYANDGLDVTINTGEAFIGGAWVCRDDMTTVTLNGSTADQTVYAGWRHNDGNRVIVGLSGSFQSHDVKLPLYDFDTDSTSVTNYTDRRQVGRPSAGNADVAVEDSGSQVISAADILNFADGLDVTASGTTAEVSAGSALARLGAAETVTGDWTFDADASLNGNALTDVERILTTGGSDVTSYIFPPDDPDGRFVIRDPQGQQPVLITENGGGVGVPNGPLSVYDIHSDGSVSVDIDNNNSSTAQTYTVTHDDGGETLFSVAEDGSADLPQGGPYKDDGVPLANLHNTITHTFPETELEPDDEAVYKHYVPSGQTLALYAWGATDGTGDASNVTVRIRKLGDSASEVSQGTARTTGNPIDTWTSNGDMFTFGIYNHASGTRNINGFVHAAIE